MRVDRSGYSTCSCTTNSASTESDPDPSTLDMDPNTDTGSQDDFSADNGTQAAGDSGEMTAQDIADPSSASDPSDPSNPADAPSNRTSASQDREGPADESREAKLINALLHLLRRLLHAGAGHRHQVQNDTPPAQSDTLKSDTSQSDTSQSDTSTSPFSQRMQAQSQAWTTIGDDSGASTPVSQTSRSAPANPVNSAPPNAVAPASATAPASADPASVSTPSGAGRDISVNGGGVNTITVRNTSNREQNYAVFTNPTPGMSSSFGRPDGFVTLKPGESANFKLPAQSSGYVQQVNNYTQADYDANKAPSSDNFKASRAEYTFNADGSLYFNDSNIDGYNSAVKMTANDQVAGSSDSILSSISSAHPGLIENIGGQQVIRGAQFFSDAIDTEARDALDLAINHNANGGDLNGNTTTYVLPNDDKAVRGAKSNQLTIDFGNL